MTTLQSMPINPLICSPSPRDIPDFDIEQRTIPCDKIRVKYHHSKRAHKILRSFFLDHTEYSHIIMHPDDLIANGTHYIRLLMSIVKYDYPVLSGICPVTSMDRRQWAACVSRMPNPRRAMKRYEFVRSTDEVLLRKRIAQVQWAGFPFMWIRRDIVERIELVDDSEWNPKMPDMGWCFDLAFCYHCMEQGIPVRVDFGVRIRHEKENHRIEGSKLKTGVEKPRVVFLNKRNETTDITEECHERYLTESDWRPYPFYVSRMNRTIMI